MRLVQLNDKMINLDLVQFIERKASGHIWLSFSGGAKGSPDVPLDADESAKLWDYLQNQSQDMME